MEGVWLWSYIALWAVVVFQIGVLFALMRQIGLLHLRVGAGGARMGNSGPELGERAPEFTAQDLNNGQLVTLGTSRGKSTLLVFISPGCSACDGVMPGVIALRQHESKTTEILLVSSLNDERMNREYIERHQLYRIPYVVSSELMDKYRIGGPPYAVLVDAEGIVRAKGLVNHLEHLESLLNARDSGIPSFDVHMATLTGTNSRETGIERNVHG